jgi:hypothetical protein
MLGASEDHAAVFNEMFDDLAGRFNERANPQRSCGLWKESEVASTRIRVERPVAPVAPAAPKPPKPPPAKSGAAAYQPTSPRVTLMERAAALNAAAKVERGGVAREITERIERLRSDPREWALFEMRVSSMVEDSRKRRGATKQFVKGNCDEVFDTSTPRSKAVRMAERQAKNAERMEAAQARAAQLEAERQVEHQRLINRHEELHRRREEQARRDERLKRQGAWLQLLALGARTARLAQQIEPQRKMRLEAEVVRRIQRAYRRHMLLRRASAIARARRALRNVVWLIRLRMHTQRKRRSADKIVAFVRAVNNVPKYLLAMRAFSYRVQQAQRYWRKRTLISEAQLETFSRQVTRVAEQRARPASPDPPDATDFAEATAGAGSIEGESGHSGEGVGALAASILASHQPVDIGISAEAIRAAVQGTMRKRWRARGDALGVYRKQLAAHKQYVKVNQVLQEASRKAPVRVGEAIHPAPQACDGHDAARILNGVTKMQRNWRTHHCLLGPLSGGKSPRVAPPALARGGTHIALMHSARHASDESLVRKMALLEQGVQAPELPLLPLLLTPDEVDETLHEARMIDLAIK